MAASFPPYDVFIWLGLTVITLLCMYFIRSAFGLCCKQPAADAASPGESDSLTDLEAGKGPTAHAPSPAPAVFLLDRFCAPRACDGEAAGGHAAAAGIRVATALVGSYILTIILVAIILAPDPGSFLYAPVAEADCEGSCGSTTHCCDYGFFDDSSLNATRVSIPHSSGALDGYLMVNTTAPYPGAPPLTILYSHGSGWNVAVQYRILRYKYLLSQGNVAILTYDYAGYGASPGDVDEDSVIASAESALSWLSSHTAVPTARITLLGRSLGGAVTAALVEAAHAAGGTVGGAGIQSSWAFFTDNVTPFFPITAFVPQGVFDGWWPSADRIKPLDTCLYAFASEDDEAVPYASTQALFDAATGVPASPAGCGTFVKVTGPAHDDPMTDTEKSALGTWFALNRLQVAP